MELEFSQGVLKNAQISNFLKTCVVGVELFHADGRTDTRDKANSLFLPFCESA
jgi:hypothetical protein